MKRIVTAGLVGAVAAAGVGATALATGGHAQPDGVAIEPLAHSTIGEKVRSGGSGVAIRTKGPRDMLTAAITVEPGASFGWHSHPGPVLVAVTEGRFTLRRVENRRCRTRTFGPGQAFVEDGERVHLGSNEGSERVRIYATFFARVGTTMFTRGEDVPEACR
jgi:quercetin dioxygenase-like cupin family protein